MPGQLISVYPEELTFTFELEKQCYCDLKLANKTEHHIAFKVKTTSPKKYFVRPNTGVILPWDTCVITVTLQAQREYPPDMQCKDKFLLQSTIVPPSTDLDEIPQDAFNKDGDKKDGDKTIEECKLRVVYAVPSGHGNLGDHSLLTTSMLRHSQQSSDNSMHSTTSFEDVQAVARLKEERDAAIQQQYQLRQELEMLKRRKSRKSNSGFSLTFAAFVGLVGVVLGFIFNLAFSVPSTK